MPVACSFAQERIWRSSRTAEGSTGYTMTSQMRIRGPLDVNAFRAAVQHAVTTHETLHTTFVERNGRPLQIVGASPEIEMPMIDLGGSQDPDAEIEVILRRHGLEPFDLEAGPLVRMWLARVTDDDHRLLRVTHHILTDWLSWRIFFTDAAQAYGALRRGERLPVITDRPSYADFAVWERERLRPDGPVFRDQLEWWRRLFEAERPPLSLPFSRPQPLPDVPVTDGRVRRWIEPEETAALEQLARRAGTTSFVVRLAVFTSQLGVETGQEQIILNTYAMTRPPGEGQSIFGFFSNPITLILPFDPKLSFRRSLARVQEVVTEAKAHSEIPYEQLCEELRCSGTPPPEIRVMFQRQGRWPPLGSAGIELDRPIYVTRGMPWGFSFGVDLNRETERWSATFDARIHDPVAVRGFIERCAALSRQIVAKPRRRLGKLRT